MLPSEIRDAWVDFNDPLEGTVYSMYADVKSLITTGVGNLIDASPMAEPWRPALALPWKRPDGVLASREEVIAEWQLVKDGSCRSGKSTYCNWADKVCFAHGGWTKSQPHTKLRLTKDDVNKLVLTKFASNWRHLEGRYAEIAGWPRDAQMAICSWAWAVGPAANWPMLHAALKAQDFRLAAIECRMVGGGTIVERNRRNRTMFKNAARVLEEGLCLEKLHYPKALDGADHDLNTTAGVQARLIELGYAPGPTDGVMGPRTVAAIKAFQTDHHLVPDGVVGPKTRTALRG